MRRRLAAVLIADVAGYTRLMEAAEAETHTRLMALMDEFPRMFEIVEPKRTAVT